MNATSRAPAISAADYLSALQSEYLDSFVPDGGAGIKFVAFDSEATSAKFGRLLAERSRQHHYVHARLTAAQTQLHLTEEVFFGVARQVDWLGLAAGILRRLYSDLGLRPGSAAPLVDAVGIRRMAAANQLDPTELYHTMRRCLEKALLEDNSMTHHFRIAMLRLCQSLLGWGDVEAVHRELVLGWLQGTGQPLARLRTLGIHTRITRHNARFLFTSLTRRVGLTGTTGTVVELNLDRLSTARRPPAGARRGFYYSKSDVLDTYEMLRQFVDSLDELRSTLIVVTFPRSLINDPHRGLPAYHALYMRVVDDVQDAHRVNPMASLVRVSGAEQEAS